MNVEELRCHECGELVLYRIDHKPECQYAPPQFTVAEQN